METILDPAEYADRVRRALTPQQTIETLRQLDITLDDLRALTGADEKTIRRWAGETGEGSKPSKPREQYRDALDRLRTAVLYILLREAMDLPDISHWLRSRTFDLGPDPEHVARRPLDALRDGQLGDVIVAVNALLHPPSLDIADDIADRLRARGESLAQEYAQRELGHSTTANGESSGTPTASTASTGHAAPAPAAHEMVPTVSAKLTGADGDPLHISNVVPGETVGMVPSEGDQFEVVGVDSEASYIELRLVSRT